MTANETTLIEAGNLIRKAWKRGQRQIVIDGRELVLKEQIRNTTMHTDQGIKKFQDRWIIATPKPPARYVPMYSIELDVTQKSRYKRAESQPYGKQARKR